MSQLGHHVVYRVHAEHKTETIKGDKTVAGSLHHEELTEFAGLVTRVRGKGKCDLIIFPPNRSPVHVDDVAEGDGDHQFRLVEPDDGKPAKK